jgi:hypothetical protein
VVVIGTFVKACMYRQYKRCRIKAGAAANHKNTFKKGEIHPRPVSVHLNLSYKLLTILKKWVAANFV